jgi:predicted transposase/invertase (TIGR01784 family)
MTQDKNNNDQNNSNIKPHDSFFKGSMGNKKLAEEFLKNYLPKDLESITDFNSIEIQKESFIENDLKSSYVDVLFKARINDRPGYFYLLCEHQSAGEYLMSFRLQKYMHKISDIHIKNHPKDKYLPIIYPIVVYANKSKYNQPKSILDLYDPKFRELAKKTLIEDFKLIDLTQINDEELQNSQYSGFMLSLLKHIRDKELRKFFELEKLRIKIISESNMDLIELALYYILKFRDDIGYDPVLEFKSAVSQSKSEEIMTIMERIEQENFRKGIVQGIEKGIVQGIEKGREEGIEKGREEGIEKGREEVAKAMLLDGDSIEKISRITGLSVSSIQKLKQ